MWPAERRSTCAVPISAPHPPFWTDGVVAWGRGDHGIDVQVDNVIRHQIWIRLEPLRAIRTAALCTALSFTSGEVFRSP